MFGEGGRKVSRSAATTPDFPARSAVHRNRVASPSFGRRPPMRSQSMNWAETIPARRLSPGESADGRFARNSRRIVPCHPVGQSQDVDGFAALMSPVRKSLACMAECPADLCEFEDRYMWPSRLRPLCKRDRTRSGRSTNGQALSAAPTVTEVYGRISFTGETRMRVW
jgi:hypothetical protein